MKTKLRITKWGHALALITALVLGLSLFSVPGVLAANSYLNETFDTNPTIGAAASDGVWYVDRYAPAAFESFDFNGENVLRVAIDGVNDGAANRGGQSSTFYNTQGRKINQQGLGVTIVKGDLYIPADWETKHRRSDLWATAYNSSDAISFYPIIGFRNPDGNTPMLSYYHGGTGEWIEVGPPSEYDRWYSFEVELDSSELVYRIDGVDVGRLDSNNSTYFGNIIVQAYNFNDSTLIDGGYDNSADNSYDVYWDNIATETSFLNATQQTFHSSIQAAIDAATAGDTITVAAGTYTENITVNKAVTIQGANAGIAAGASPGTRGAETVVDGGFIVNASGPLCL